MTFLNPSEVLNKIELKSTMIAADFGVGSGGWTIPLAKILKDGIVYAIDILEEPLYALKMKLDLEKIRNVKVIRSNLERKMGSTLPESFVDLVLIVNLLFQCENKKAVLEEAKRITKTGGIILVVDWIKDNPLTKEIEFVSLKEIEEKGRQINLKTEREFEAGKYHRALIFKKID